MSEPFYIKEAEGELLPIVISVPHSGTEFPAELADSYNPELIAAPDDTDWFVHDLYDFAPSMGITVVHARYSRWVIDLNRAPSNAALYDDGRMTTALVPLTDFSGNHLYRNSSLEPTREEIERRIRVYYNPYHERIESELTSRLSNYPRVLLWDAHSIRRSVPTIRSTPFTDMILGDNLGLAAGSEFSEIALATLGGGPFSLSHNDPFKGGYITRYFGRPIDRIHALQLEMSKDVYMDDAETHFDIERAARIREKLEQCLGRLAEVLSQ
jgi:N-formylglutamate deformylase